MTNEDIRPKSILYTKEGDFKIICNPTQTTTYQSISQNNAFILEGSRYFPSPELLAFLSKNEANPEYNHILSASFSLGMTILSACTLNDIDDCYDWDTLTIDFKNIATKLNWMKNIYSERICKLLDKMLKLDHEKRSDFWKLEEFINSITNTNINNIQHQRRKGGSSIYNIQLDVSGSATPKKLKPSRSGLLTSGTSGNNTSSKKIGSENIDPLSNYETYQIINPSSIKTLIPSNSGSQLPSALALSPNQNYANQQTSNINGNINSLSPRPTVLSNTKNGFISVKDKERPSVSAYRSKSQSKFQKEDGIFINKIIELILY